VPGAAPHEWYRGDAAAREVHPPRAARIVIGKDRPLGMTLDAFDLLRAGAPTDGRAPVKPSKKDTEG
jgi:hypothetical protein